MIMFSAGYWLNRPVTFRAQSRRFKPQHFQKTSVIVGSDGVFSELGGTQWLESVDMLPMFSAGTVVEPTGPIRAKEHDPGRSKLLLSEKDVHHCTHKIR
jgi:hypothetical protein